MFHIFNDNYDRIDFIGRLNINQYIDLYSEETEYIVIWYGELIRENRRKLVKVYFYDCDTQKQFWAGIPIEVVLKLPIGSVWKGGKCRQIYNFDTIFTQIEAHDEQQGERPNFSYTNHFGVSKGDGEYVLNPKLYPVNNIETDSNTNIVFQHEGNKIVIPSVLFFAAHYGVSKEINRVLISYHMQEVKKRLNLNNCNEGLITIPDRCVIGDSIFLYHLKMDDYTNRVVEKLNQRMLRTDRENYPLKVEPYHNQKIELKIKGLQIDQNTVLCTEILAISMPVGEPIEYRIDRSNSLTYADGTEPDIEAIVPIVNNIESEEIILEADRDINNIVTAVVRHRNEPIGEIRELIRTQIMTLNEAVANCRSIPIQLEQDQLNGVGLGERGNANGDVATLLVLNQHENFRREQRINNFEQLLRYAQDLKVCLPFAPLIIDCVNFGDEDVYLEETVLAMESDLFTTRVQSIYVMRLKTRIGLFFIFDCNMRGSQTSGVAIKVNVEYANNDEIVEDCVRRTLNQLFRNQGKLSNIRPIEEHANITYFKHSNGDSANWVKTAIGKLI